MFSHKCSSKIIDIWPWRGQISRRHRSPTIILRDFAPFKAGMMIFKRYVIHLTGIKDNKPPRREKNFGFEVSFTLWSLCSRNVMRLFRLSWQLRHQRRHQRSSSVEGAGWRRKRGIICHQNCNSVPVLVTVYPRFVGKGLCRPLSGGALLRE